MSDMPAARETKDMVKANRVCIHIVIFHIIPSSRGGDFAHEPETTGSPKPKLPARLCNANRIECPVGRRNRQASGGHQLSKQRRGFGMRDRRLNADPD